MTCEAADDEGLLGWQIHSFDHQSDDGGKGVAIVEAKGCHAVATTAQGHSIGQTHRRQMF
ncbi:MAG: hypothetical protein B7Z37_26365 [Verrucomicrobia bacterium 12-59-8]|nr:MAG: hypothetical protein B7Z37_26365 [Verrucomicrobia bacterium 12-59-8]